MYIDGPSHRQGNDGFSSWLESYRSFKGKEDGNSTIMRYILMETLLTQHVPADLTRRLKDAHFTPRVLAEEARDYLRAQRGFDLIVDEAVAYISHVQGLQQLKKRNGSTRKIVRRHHA